MTQFLHTFFGHPIEHTHFRSNLHRYHNYENSFGIVYLVQPVLNYYYASVSLFIQHYLTDDAVTDFLINCREFNT